jgi:hypothetical protein
VQIGRFSINRSVIRWLHLFGIIIKEYDIGLTVIFSPYKNKDSKHELTYQKIGWWDEKFYLYFIPHAQSF